MIELPPELDALEVLVVVDNETDTLSSVAEGIPQIPEAVHLAMRRPPVRVHEGHACHVLFDQLCCACHGLSVLLSARRGVETHRVLFDVGPYPHVWLENAGHLDIDLASIEALFLSHWHFDHSGGFPQVVAAIAAARRAAGHAAPLVVDLHPDRPDQRGLMAANGSLMLLPAEPDFADIAAAGGAIVKAADAHLLGGGFFYGSGAIPRVTAYETGLAGHHSFRDGVLEADPLIMDERFLAARVRGRGVSVFSACSHAGIVNACLGAQDAFPDTPIDLVLGGYHLAGRIMEMRIEDTVRDLGQRVRPRIVAPGHCTGWRAKAALAQAFAPAHYAPSVVGSLYRLAAPA
ncbi:MAG: MBL fold metallo-hydrolase [Gammaproteobacteria bacterium]|nr:MBL fold metallo-hydrolase [Gammaproteobacteria bacterium]